MNGARKPKPLRTVRLGDVVYDEQKRLLMLCRSCEHHFVTFEAFQKHLADCSGLRHVVAPTDLLSYDEAKRETRLVNGRQELHIYDIEAVRSSSTFDWEAELEDPRWYTDPKPSLSPAKAKSDLAKENVVEIELQLPNDEPDEEELPAKRPRTLNNLRRRPILTAQQQRKTRSTGGQPVTKVPTVKTKIKEPILAPAVMEQLKRMTEAPPKRSPTAASGAELPATRTSRLASKQTPPKTTPGTPPKTSQSQLPMVSIPMDGTQKILNKLRACGVDVKRGNTLLNDTPPAAESSTKNQEALDIMRKLQSKGIRCTKLTKQ